MVIVKELPCIGLMGCSGELACKTPTICLEHRGKGTVTKGGKNSTGVSVTWLTTYSPNVICLETQRRRQGVGQKGFSNFDLVPILVFWVEEGSPPYLTVQM